jgi:hypothetical protein
MLPSKPTDHLSAYINHLFKGLGTICHALDIGTRRNLGALSHVLNSASPHSSVKRTGLTPNTKQSQSGPG